MMKKAAILLSAMAALSLTGCSDNISAQKAVVDDFVGTVMLQTAGVTQDPEYVQYVEYRDAGMLDTDGYYADPEDAPSEDHHGQIKVTFAENSNLKVRYYTDESCTVSSVISSSAYYVNPGDQLFATVETDRDVYTSEYDFSEFRIDEYSDDGNRVESTVLHMEKLDGKYVLNIPEDYTGTSISILPLGEFSLKTIKATANCADDNGGYQSVSGTWTVDGSEFSGTTEISCTSAYTVTFQYESSEYFFVSSEPQCFYSDNEDGFVEFERCEANSTITDFSVVLHRNMTIQITSSADRRAEVDDDKNKIDVTPGKPLQLVSKKYGDTITIKTDKEWPELSSIQELRVTSEEQLSDGEYKYTMRVHAKDGDFVFDPNDYQYEHGTVNFYLNGNLVTDTEYLSPDTIITFEQGSADQGYWLKGTDHSIVISENKEETIADLKAIEFVPQDPVTVRLPQPVAGGRITYVDPESQRTIAEPERSTYQGTEIDMIIHAWDGWTSDVVEYTYMVTGDKTQTVKVNGKDIDDVFAESEDHKPKLTFTLDKSVGETMDFAVSASGCSESDIRYNSKPFVSNTITETIGTDQPVLISVYHRTNQTGKAVRAEITRTATDKTKNTETVFLDDSRNAFDPIEIYEAGTNDAPETTYTAIDITISVIDAEKFSQIKSKEHTTITVERETGETLSAGDLVSPLEKVAITISPDYGYYLTAEKNISGDAYVDKMKYSEYVERIDSILEDIEVHEYIIITLDESDTYATYQYQLGRDTVSGQIRVKEGQKLKLTYTISDDTYGLDEAHGGFLFGLGSSTSKATEVLVITEDMNGTVITKESFGIKTGRKDLDS